MPHPDKPTLRLEQRKLRNALPDVSSQICAVLIPWLAAQAVKTVLAYKAFASEISLEALPIALPDIMFLTTRVAYNKVLTLHDFSSATTTNKYGILEPPLGTPEIEPRAVDVALIPGLAFTRDGARLGYGGGFYDQLLPQLRSDCALVGVTRAALLVSTLPLEPWDVAMTHLVVEEGLFDCRTTSLLRDFKDRG